MRHESEKKKEHLLKKTFVRRQCQDSQCCDDPTFTPKLPQDGSADRTRGPWNYGKPWFDGRRSYISPKTLGDTWNLRFGKRRLYYRENGTDQGHLFSTVTSRDTRPKENLKPKTSAVSTPESRDNLNDNTRVE